MSYSQTEVTDFANLFTSNTSAYGMTVVGEIKDGKAESKSSLVHQPLTAAVLQRHLKGEISVGAAPLRDGNKVRWCAIDIDNYAYNLMDIVAAIEDFDLPLCPCFSKSKKLHIYCFFSEEVDAELAINMMKWYATTFRCDPKVEVFPKQAKMSANNKFYSWINLPYFEANNEKNHRKGVKSDGSLYTLSEFVERAKAKQLTYDEHQDKIKALPYYGAPPCVLSGVILRDVPPGTRNNWLYNVACFLRMDDENAEIVEPLLELNDTLHTPIAEREIRTTVAKVAGRSYYYQCSGMLGCNKSICKTSDKGIGNNKSTKFSFGQLTKVLTDPIQWEWEVNGQVLRFHDTEQIMNQRIFRKQCMEKINDMPYQVADDKWTTIIRRALENVIEQHVEVYGNFGAGSQFLEILVDYFNGGRRYTDDANQIATYGKIFVDKEHKTFMFSSTEMFKYVTEKNALKISQAEVRARIVELGAQQVNGTVWSIPMESIPIKNTPEPVIDYHDNDANVAGEDNYGAQF